MKLVAGTLAKSLKYLLDRLIKKAKKKVDTLDEIAKLYSRVPEWSEEEKARASWIEHSHAKGSIKIVSRGHIMEGEVFLVTDLLPVFVGRTDSESGDHGKYVKVSRRHCVFRFSSGHIAVQDLNSKFGTFVNDERLDGAQVRRLADGDIIKLGSLRLRFQSEGNL